MDRKILFLTFLVAISSMTISCGGSGGGYFGDENNPNRILGINFPVVPQSLISFTRTIDDPDSVYGTSTELYLIFPDGTHEHRLTNNHADDDFSAFNPNGRRLAYASNSKSGDYGNKGVYWMNSGGQIFNITDDQWEFDSLSIDWGPGFIISSRINTLIMAPFDVVGVHAFSPLAGYMTYIDTKQIASYDSCISRDGKLLAFCARPQGATYFGDMEIYLLQKGSDTPLQVTRFGEQDPDPMNLEYTLAPSFSFDGKYLVFQSTGWGDNYDLGYIDVQEFLANPTEPNPIRLTESPSDETGPCFSPDRDWIAYASNSQDGNFELYTMTFDVEDDSDIRLTNTVEDESNPDWSPFYY